MFPEELKYTKSHEYVKAEGNSAVFGVSQYAVDQVKDIVYVELPKIGQELRAGSPFGSLESVKAVFELIAPASGKVTAVNEVINSSPEAVSKSPYAEGWMVKVELSNPAELEKLMNSSDYQKYIESEGHH
ncbi:MAG: glycine cleavage system protein H [Candidatus Firestonebacteria bacterium RIFOXYC2_FULL_39_67]|nr:MAG: glycine cleavage system protein H [Candidatus Firestonebacteria bacterium RIFOXYD2_FULL_39_29]OGF54047.1 MAG: glycine cleavage system protein H [Candidatus Firestonebacteria bacterium RIFOXYC2_FULL_39_67]OGF57921.1 MAG: glycine cleavage system protein H [Candidatus Firestonebacteria bacterium RifOxyC12_full_39_7]